MPAPPKSVRTLWVAYALALLMAACGESPSSVTEGAVAFLLRETCNGEGPCIFSEELDCDSKDFFRGAWEFQDSTAFGECYAPPEILPGPTGGPCSSDDDCAHGAFCEQGFCSDVHNYFCAERVEKATSHGCDQGGVPACSQPGSSCRDEWFECPDTPARRLRWPALGDACEDIVLSYEIVAEQRNEGSSRFFCSKRHEGCAMASDCAGQYRPSADHCGPVLPAVDRQGMNQDCFLGEPATPACPDSHDPAWPVGLGAGVDATLVQRAEQKIGTLCARAGCGATARCRPGDGSLGYTDGGLGIQGSSGIKDDSFIGHARVCESAGVETCNDRDRPGAEDGSEPCVGGSAVDDTRDALVPGSVSRREVDIRCQCLTAP